MGSVHVFFYTTKDNGVKCKLYSNEILNIFVATIFDYKSEAKGFFLIHFKCMYWHEMQKKKETKVKS